MIDSKRKSEIPALTGLRGVAALMVFVYHLPWLAGYRDTPEWTATGWQALINSCDSGVGLFFLLSGFLLAIPFWKGLRDGVPPNLQRYTIHRAARILPGYWFALVVFQLWHPRTWTAQGMAVFGLEWFGLDSWFQRAWEFRIHSVLWTIGIEWMFYAMLPVLFLILLRIPGRVGPLALLFISVCAGPAYEFLARRAAPLLPSFFLGGAEGGNAVSQSPFYYLGWFGLGATGAWLWLRPSFRSLPVWLWEILFWSAAIYSVWVLSNSSEGVWRTRNFSLPAAWPWLPLANLLLILSAPGTRSARLVLDASPLKTLGVLSYGLYLWHLPVTSAVFKGSLKEHFEGVPLLVAGGVVALVGSLGVAFLFYVFVEKPVMKWASDKQTLREAWVSLKSLARPEL